MMQAATVTSAPVRERLTLLRDGSAAFPAILEAIAKARHEVVVEMYWFDDSPIARRIIEALAERARAGVAVCVSYDAIGSIGSDGARFDPLRAAGGKVEEYNPIAPWRRRFRLAWVSQRDHRKIIVVDGTVAFVGGLNIGTPWVSRDEGGGGWRDDVARVEGPAAERLRRLFYDTWRRQGGECPPDLSQRTRWTLLAAERKESGLVRAITEHGVAVLGHDGWGARMVIRRAYLTRIRGAERRIIIANSYFIPDGAVRRAMEGAARRGVEVKVILPKVSDVPAVAWATRHLYTRLMKAGIQVYEWTDGILHSKTALVDDWATTGSYNLDFLSWRTNLESNVATGEPGFVAAVEKSFEDDLARSERLDPDVWARRPWIDKARSWGWYLFRKFL